MRVEFAVSLLGTAILLLATVTQPPGSAGAEEGQGAVNPTPRELLQRAFERRYSCDTQQTLTLHLHSKGREIQTQRIEMATKTVDGHLRAIARFTYPPDLRDTALLMIEQEGRADDYFLFLPTLSRIRRVSGAQRGDSFMGTDLSYEDLERHRIDDFQDFDQRRETLAGESVFNIGARPAKSSGYDRAEFLVAEKDSAILETRYYRATIPEPFKTIRFPRPELLAQKGVILPQAILVENHRRRTNTEISIDDLTINPALDDHLFTTNALERESEIID